MIRKKDIGNRQRIFYLYVLNSIIMRIIRHILPFILFLIITSISPLKAITSVADSLEKVLVKTTDNKLKLALLTTLTKEFASLSFEKSLQYGNQAISLARKLDEPQVEVDALLIIGDAYSYQNNFPESFENYEKAQKLSEKIKYKKGIDS